MNRLNKIKLIFENLYLFLARFISNSFIALNLYWGKLRLFLLLSSFALVFLLIYRSKSAWLGLL